MATTEVITFYIDSLVDDFLVHQRKGCQPLPLGEIETMIANGEITTAELGVMFKQSIDSKIA